MPHSKISAQKCNNIFAYLCQDITITAVAKLVWIKRNTANYYYNEIRKILSEQFLSEGGKETEEFELDESYFGENDGAGQQARPWFLGYSSAGGKYLLGW